MKTSLIRINELIAGSEPDNYDSISYNKYFRDLTDVSNRIMQDEEKQTQKIAEILKAINDLKTGAVITNEVKSKLIDALLK